MKIGVLTSSRADYGIYSSLLNDIKADTFFSLEVIVFGPHLSKNHGYTFELIESDKYPTVHTINSIISNDDKESIASSYGLTVLKFADFWHKNKYDLVFCLGDRFEMSAAVQAAIPFGIKFAHIHGGETTLGAIDNVYRHQITLASFLHFTATTVFKEKVVELKGSSKNVYTVGSLSLDSINTYNSISRKVFFKTFKIPNEPFILATFHPETKTQNDNKFLSKEMKSALSVISKDFFLVVTMPNADAEGSLYRESLKQLKCELPNRILLVENFGKQNYFTALTYCKIIIGNSSSGIIEAASFGKYVINVGDRQKGRVQSKNIINSVFEKNAIVSATYRAAEFPYFSGDNIYYQEGVSKKIIKIIKSINENF